MVSKFSKPYIEKALLGLVYIQDRCASYVIPYLTREDFTIHENACFFDILLDLFSSNNSINYEQVLLLAQKKKYSFINFAFISDLEINAGLTTNITANIKELVRLTKLRTLERKLGVVLNQIQADVEIDEEVVIGEIQNLLLDLDKNASMQNFISSKEASDEMLKELHHKRTMGPNDISGIATGFLPIDMNTQGFQPGELIIIAARPAMGKTAFALNIANNVALKHKKVVFFTLEMTATSLMTRLYGINTEIDLSKFKQASSLSDNDMLRIEAVRRTYINKLDLLIDESSDNDINNLIWKCRRLNKISGIDLIVVDYLQLLSGSDGSRSRDSRQTEISKISRALKTLALELKVPVIALSQLSREVEKREDKRPLLSDLRESGAIEQDADIVMFLYRKNYYKKKKEIVQDQLEHGDIGDVTDVIIAKHRNGPTDDYQLFFRMNCGKFMNPLWEVDDNINSNSTFGDDE
ncbi:replicative DNA helicase [Mycoplasmopsis felifaucium]|uniref:Replicative DNA helicase n=1 Tax=Mycoplasmopsis felifaucium TaxID=35768 RepID=A0ABZ2RPH3_9BACT